MAHAVGHPPLQSAIGWLTRPPPAVRYGLKLATAITASIWIAFASGLDWSLTIWITVLFVAQPNVGGSIKKGLARIAGTVVAALASIAIYGLFAQQPPLMLASISGAFALAVYGMTGARYQYAWLVFGFTTILILMKAMAGSDQIETLAFERATLTGLGLLIVFVADMFFWPVRAGKELRESLAARCGQLGDTLKQHLGNLPAAEAPAQAGASPSSPLIQQLGLVDQFREEVGVSLSRARALSRIALLLEELASRVRVLGHNAEADPRASPETPSTTLPPLSGGLHAALGESARALSGDDAPEPFADELDGLLADFEAEPTAHPEARQSSLAATLRDVVALLRRLEEALLAPARHGLDSKAATASEAAPRATIASAREWFRLDPIRLQLGLRAGISGGGVILAMLVMGWSLSEDMLPMILAPILAFIVAGSSSTRGAAKGLGLGLAAGILLGWLIADLSMVFFFAHFDRMPLSLVYPFAVSVGAGYLIVRGSLLGPLGTLFGLLVAILPVFISDAPPEDVDESYSLVCGLFVGLAAALIAQRVLWPRTAMQTFLERAAGQLDLCLRARGGAEPGAEDAPAGQGAGALVGAYAKQLTLLGQLHAQAHREPVERALDDGRRSELLALIQNLFDATLHDPREAETFPEEARAVLAPLRAASVRQDEALRASLAASARSLRGDAPGPDSGLADAGRGVEARLDELRDHRDLERMLGARQLDDLLAGVESRRHLSARQAAIEAWLADWHLAEGAEAAG